MVRGPSAEDDRCVGESELGQHLAAGAAGRAGGGVEIGDGDGFDADAGSELGNGGDQSRALGADGQAVAHVLYIGSGDNGTVTEAERRADAEAGVRGIGVERSLAGLIHQ